MCRCPARLRPRRRLRSRLRLLEGGDEQHVLLALDQDFSLQPRQELATMSGKPQMLCCAALPSRARQDRLGPCLPVRC
jgi:hypothetical protein